MLIEIIMGIVWLKKAGGLFPDVPKVHDPYRIEYLRQHIAQIQEAITDGAQMLGYNPWSAIDLISTHEGMRKRYGFIFVDRDEFDLKTMKRYLKDSGYWYKKVIETNGADLSD